MLSHTCKIHKPTRRGFTLIELLVVVLIIGVLLGIAIPLYLASVKNSSTTAVKANLRQIGLAAQSYYVKSVGVTYPTNLNQIAGAGTQYDLPVSINGAQGPNAVIYKIISGPTGPFQAEADETTIDSFGGTGTTDKMVYDLATNTYTIH
jgi:prepilin-type N-terminal cleavage/methylation domain-containing protein